MVLLIGGERGRISGGSKMADQSRDTYTELTHLEQRDKGTELKVKGTELKVPKLILPGPAHVRRFSGLACPPSLTP